MEDYSLVSVDIPLISNLNILENISLIKEVHEHISTLEAQNLAREKLFSIDLEHIAQFRVPACSAVEIFYTMFIRASMSQEETIYILNPQVTMGNLKYIDKILTNLQKINCYKNIVILDIIDNEDSYKGCLCNIVK